MTDDETPEQIAEEYRGYSDKLLVDLYWFGDALSKLEADLLCEEIERRGLKP